MFCLQVCQHPNSRMREWGAEALTSLIKAGLTFSHDPPLSQNQVKKKKLPCFKKIFNVKSSSPMCSLFLNLSNR